MNSQAPVAERDPGSLVPENAAALLDELGSITDEAPGLTRTFLSPALTRSKALVATWMQAAHLEVFEDQAGNLIGRRACENADAPTVVCGSHLDTVRQAGKFDGALGVVAGIVAAAELKRREISLPYHLEIVGFSDEEGVRFQSAYLGSKFYTKTLDDLTLTQCDAEGCSVGEAITTHRPAFPSPPRRQKVLAYLEAHIEQGPVLEQAGLALGVVTDIAGQRRLRLTLEGCRGHAGTTPMAMRRDALTGAAECALLVESRASSSGVVATVGELQIKAPAGNVIPGEVSFSLDVRGADRDELEKFCRELLAEMEGRMKLRHLKFRSSIAMSTEPVPCAPDLWSRLETLILSRQSACPRLVSGAGHDAVALAAVAPVALLFVRCRAGLSHHPDEWAEAADIAEAIRVLSSLLAAIPS